MRYWIDCEYNGFGGQLLSLALVREDGHNLYIVYDVIQELDPWVKKNVMPILRCEMPKNVKLQLASLLDNRGAYMIQEFFGDDRFMLALIPITTVLGIFKGSIVERIVENDKDIA